MEDSSIGSVQEGQNLNELQHYLVQFNKDEQNQLDASSVNLAETENATAVYVSTTENINESAATVNIQEYYAPPDDILHVNAEEQQIACEESVPEHSIIKLDSAQAEIVAKMTSAVNIDQNYPLTAVHTQLSDLSTVQVSELSAAQVSELSTAPVSELPIAEVSELQTAQVSESDFVNATDGDGGSALAVANSSNEIKRIIRVLSVGGDKMQIEEASLQVIADDTDLNEQQLLTSDALGVQQISIENVQLLSDDATRNIIQQDVDSSNPVAVLASVAANTTNVTNHLPIASESEINNAQLVALQNSEDSSQPHLVAVQSTDDCTPHTLHVIENSIASTPGNSFLMPSSGTNYQTLTFMPTENRQGGEVSYLLIVSQGGGDKDLSVYDYKEDSREIKEEVIEENGLTKRIIKITSKKLLQPSPTQLMCQYCNYTSPKHYLLTRHMKSHSEDRPYKCDTCQRSFKTMASLQNHKNTHTGMRPHKCKQCIGAFTTSGELVRHVRYKHTFEKPHKCKMCEYASVELSKLKRHMRSHTGERPYRCEFCSYASSDTHKLKRHLRTHTGEKPYHCEICQARFTQSNSLKAHKLIHFGNKPVFQCDLCPTTCGRKTDLKIHMQKLHTSERLLCCRKCNKTFPDRYSYKLHAKSHEGEKCFKCGHCNYAALSRRHLDSHLLTHSGLKPYECNECNQSFRQKQLLKRHKNLYHTPNYTPPMPREKTHECTECDKTFAHKGNLMRHLSHHDSDDDSSNQKEMMPKLLSSPRLTTQQLLQGNLLTDLREGKLGSGPIPQVVIVHPDGRVEEVTSKLQAVHEADQVATQREENTMDDFLLAMKVTSDAITPNETETSLNVAEINIEAMNSVAEMKEASTQVELESDYESDEDINSVTSGSDLMTNGSRTVTIVHEPLPVEHHHPHQPEQSLPNGSSSPPIITLTTLSSELTLPNGDKDDVTLTDTTGLLETQLLDPSCSAE